MAKPKLGPLLPVIGAILEADRTGPVKQRHTAKRIFERLRYEHGFAGGYTVVKDYVHICRARSRETFVPPPRHRRRGGAKPGHRDHRSRHRRNYHHLIHDDADDMQRAPRGPLHIATAHHHWPAFTPAHWPGIRPPLTTERDDVKINLFIDWSF